MYPSRELFATNIRHKTYSTARETGKHAPRALHALHVARAGNDDNQARIRARAPLVLRHSFA
ncbi:MAG: hypothetical protein LBD64_02055 [Odoribacteraceae bacterium]|nr:hypothetical protein [Odoribacteraceae bacterium]